MILYYSNSKIVNQSQPDPEMSLGGYISNSQVSPGGIGNIFAGLSTYTKQRGATDIRGIFLKNDSGVAMTDLKLYYSYPTDLVGKIIIEISAVSATNNNQMEKIPNGSTNPYYAEFVEAIDQTNPVLLINNIPIDGVIGLWIRRTVKAFGAPSCDDLYDIYKEVIPPTDLTNMNTPPAPVAPSNELPNIQKEETIFRFSWT